VSVVITGIGAVTVAGVGVDRLWRWVLAGRKPSGRQGFPPPPGLPPTSLVRAATIGEYDVREHVDIKKIRGLTPESRAFLVAAALACREADVPDKRCDDPSFGVVVGTTTAGLNDYVEMFASRLDLGVHNVNPARGPLTGPNTPAAQFSIFAGAAGPNLTICSGDCSAIDALAVATDLLRSGRADTVIVGGVDTLSYLLLCARQAADPTFGAVEVARPFDRRRTGAVPGEAAVAFVLERSTSAHARGARVLAEVLGAGTAFGTNSRVAAGRAARDALASAVIDPSDVETVLASAAGSVGPDAAEADLLHDLFGTNVSVCSVKGAVGECAAAAAAVHVAVAALSLCTGIVPATTGYREADPSLPPLSITTSPRTVDRGPALIHSFSPDGHAAALVLGRGDP
jgi:3-oxoacyl-(acyl-carrier-protein) synthase